VQSRAPLVGRAFLFGTHDWLVSFTRGRTERVQVELNGQSGEINWTAAGRELDWPPIARGEHFPAAKRLHWLMIFSGFLFVLPFVDARRLGRLLHLDLIAVLAFGIPFALVQAGEIYAATPLVYPVLLYLLVRLLWIALRRGGPAERLTWMSPRVMATALVLLLAARYGYDLVDGVVSDVGYASLFGADSILHGYPLYDSSIGSGHLDAYGPLAYLAYVPFILVFPFKGLSHDATDAARAAAVAFDLGTVVVLLALGRRLRPGHDGRALGMALAWAFAACPWTLYVLARNTNDSLVALLLALVLLLAASPLGRGMLIAAAAATKFAPLVLGALFARGDRERGSRPFLIYSVALVGTLAVLVLPYVPDGGVREVYDSTIGFQLSRTSPFSIWGLHPAWEPLRPVVTVAVAALALGALVLPRDRSVPALAAAGAALLVAVQIGAVHWYWFYIPWFLPYLLVALFSRSYAGSVRNSGISSARAVAVKSS
jgi:hypothetical protein